MIASYQVRPADELVFLQNELRKLFFVSTALLAFGFMTMLVALCGMVTRVTNFTVSIITRVDPNATICRTIVF